MDLPSIENVALKIQQSTQSTDLPTLPTVYNQLRGLLAREDCTFENVAAIVQSDPAITLKILKLVNSAAFGFNSEIRQIKSAVRLIGFNQLSHLILGLSVINLTESTEESEFNFKQFWKHSIAVGVGARLLLSKSNVPIHLELEDAFVAGLLHDIGKLISEKLFRTDFHRAIALCKTEGIQLITAENRILGFNHQETGSFILRDWGLPKIFEYVCYHHHAPQVPSEPHALAYMACATHLANAISKALDLGSGGDPYVPPINYEAWQYLDLPLNELESICQQIRKDTKELYQLMF